MCGAFPTTLKGPAQRELGNLPCIQFYWLLGGEFLFRKKRNKYIHVGFSKGINKLGPWLIMLHAMDKMCGKRSWHYLSLLVNQLKLTWYNLFIFNGSMWDSISNPFTSHFNQILIDNKNPRIYIYIYNQIQHD